jgi:hypothetical protein
MCSALQKHVCRMSLKLALPIFALLFLYSLHPSMADEAACRAQYDDMLGRCMLESQGTAPSGDFSYISLCQRKYEPELQHCITTGSQSNLSTLPPPGCPDAKEAVDWVFRDAGARQTYLTNRQNGRSPFDAVFNAQAHNPRAQADLNNCRNWVTGYLGTVPLANGGIPTVGSPAPGCDDARAAVDWVLKRDMAARETFIQGRTKGYSPFESVVFAQGHNPSAQRELRRCQAWATNYISTLSPPGPSGGGQLVPPKPSLDPYGNGCASVGRDIVDDYDEEFRRQGLAPSMWKVVITTGNLCQRPVQIAMCVTFRSAEIGRESRQTHLLPINPPAQIFVFFAIMVPTDDYGVGYRFCEFGQPCKVVCAP